MYFMYVSVYMYYIKTDTLCYTMYMYIHCVTQCISFKILATLRTLL